MKTPSSSTTPITEVCLPVVNVFFIQAVSIAHLSVRIPEKWKHLYPKGKMPGSTIDRIVSFIDMPKTWVSLTGTEITDNFQGRIFLGPDIEQESQYHFSWRGRADERFDCVRVMRDEQFAYHKNYAPFAPNGQYLAYMHKMKATGAWERHHQAGKTNSVTGRFFEPRPSEEFYDNFKDFHNIDNQIDDPLHQAKIKELKKELRRQQLKYFDCGLMPEGMRARIIKENKTTVYAFVRDPALYPLAKYLDYSDLALSRKKANLKTLTKGAYADKDPGRPLLVSGRTTALGRACKTCNQRPKEGSQRSGRNSIPRRLGNIQSRKY